MTGGNERLGLTLLHEYGADAASDVQAGLESQHRTIESRHLAHQAAIAEALESGSLTPDEQRQALQRLASGQLYV